MIKKSFLFHTKPIFVFLFAILPILASVKIAEKHIEKNINLKQKKSVLKMLMVKDEFGCYEDSNSVFNMFDTTQSNCYNNMNMENISVSHNQSELTTYEMFEYNDFMEAMTVYAFNESSILINPNIFAALTVKSSVVIKGSSQIDGRDWDHMSTLIVDNGVFGVISTGALSMGRRSMVGGNGIFPVNKPIFPIVNEISDEEEYFFTPEEVLGLPENILDKYKSKTMPRMPFHGLVYLNPDKEIDCHNFRNSNGILICHNEKGTALLKNIRGNFKGIIIADRIEHESNRTNILGAVVILSKSGESFILKDNATIRYSSKAISNLNNYINIVCDSIVNKVSWK